MVAPVLGRGENRKISPWGMMKNSWRKTIIDMIPGGACRYEKSYDLRYLSG
jgi:hypothetical protein